MAFEQLSPSKFLLASLFTFLLSFVVVTLFFDSPLYAADELYAIPGQVTNEAPVQVDNGAIMMVQQTVNNFSNSTYVL